MKPRVYLSYDHNEDTQFAEEFMLFYGSENAQVGTVPAPSGDPVDRSLLKDTEVTVVLVGPKTSGRRSVDTEISLSLTPDETGTVNRLVGLLLPNCGAVPGRLWDNLLPSDLFVRSPEHGGYAPVLLWEEVLPPPSWYVGCAPDSVIRDKRENWLALLQSLTGDSSILPRINNQRPLLDRDIPVTYWPWWI